MIELEFIGDELPPNVPAWCQDLADALVRGAVTHPGQWARFPRTGTPGVRQYERDVSAFATHFRPADGYLAQVRVGEWFVRFKQPPATKGRRR